MRSVSYEALFDVRRKRCAVDRFADGLEQLLCPSEVGVQEYGCREGRAQVTSREGFVLCKDPNALSAKGDVGQPGFKCVVPIRFLRKDRRLWM